MRVRELGVMGCGIYVGKRGGVVRGGSIEGIACLTEHESEILHASASTLLHLLLVSSKE